MVFSTKTKRRILKKYLNRFVKEYQKFITDYKKCQRTASNILILRNLLNLKSHKYVKYTVKPTVIHTSNNEPCITVKTPNLKKLEESGIKVTIITKEKLK